MTTATEPASGSSQSAVPTREPASAANAALADKSRPPRYLGPLKNPKGGAVELYEDPTTKSTFAVRDGETVEQAQARHRANWSGKLSEPRRYKSTENRDRLDVATAIATALLGPHGWKRAGHEEPYVFDGPEPGTVAEMAVVYADALIARVRRAPVRVLPDSVDKIV